MKRFWHHISRVYNHIKIYCKNIIKWSPILWNDQDYDNAFIFDVLIFKIRATAKCIEKNKAHMGWKREVEKMRLCVKLLERISNEYYEMEHLTYVDTKFSVNEKRILQIETLRDDSNEYLQLYPHDLKSIPTEGSTAYRALRLGIYRHNKAKRILFKLLDENIERWWD